MTRNWPRVQESGSRHWSLQRGYALTISSICSTNACRVRICCGGRIDPGKTLWKYPRIDRSIGAPSARRSGRRPRSPPGASHPPQDGSTGAGLRPTPNGHAPRPAASRRRRHDTGLPPSYAPSHQGACDPARPAGPGRAPARHWFPCGRVPSWRRTRSSGCPGRLGLMGHGSFSNRPPWNSSVVREPDCHTSVPQRGYTTEPRVAEAHPGDRTRCPSHVP